VTPPPTVASTPTPMLSEMIHIPAGNFIQGSTDAQISDAYELCVQTELSQYAGAHCVRSALEDELPQREVHLDEFFIEQYEVTNAQYAMCVGNGVCNPPSPTSSNNRASYFDDPQYADYPVIYVTWYDADRYCQWADRRLPTEAEWEKAARGENGKLWPWGNSFSSERCNLRHAVAPNTFDTAQVGSYPEGASPRGAMNMVGNVWEWVADWYDQAYYASAVGRNPEGPPGGDKRVIRAASGARGNKAREKR
jgi:formylglycine-generating enzyme required for sulfatase activity